MRGSTKVRYLQPLMSEETSIVEDLEVIKELIRESFPEYLPRKQLDIKEEADKIKEREGY